eukprot:COSAG01_NODE_1458_length_10252_cov_247.726288_9_plen_133_part_00
MRAPAELGNPAWAPPPLSPATASPSPRGGRGRWQPLPSSPSPSPSLSLSLSPSPSQHLRSSDAPATPASVRERTRRQLELGGPSALLSLTPLGAGPPRRSSSSLIMADRLAGDRAERSDALLGVIRGADRRW